MGNSVEQSHLIISEPLHGGNSNNKKENRGFGNIKKTNYKQANLPCHQGSPT